jgi:hypothetical protein
VEWLSPRRCECAVTAALRLVSCKVGWLSPPGVEVSSDGPARAPGLQSGVAIPEPTRCAVTAAMRLVSCQVGWLSPPGVEVSGDGQARAPGLQSGVAIPAPTRMRGDGRDAPRLLQSRVAIPARPTCAVTLATSSELARFGGRPSRRLNRHCRRSRRRLRGGSFLRAYTQSGQPKSFRDA